MSVRLSRPRSVPPAASGGGGSVTHGKQITTANTGYLAYFDSGLGRNVQFGDLTTVSGTHYISDYTAGGTGGTAGNPKVVSKYHFTGDVIFDVDYVTLRACLLDNPTTSFINPTHHIGANLEWCTIAPATVGDECMHYESWSAYRTQMGGCSDGAKINGGALPQYITECYIRVAGAGAADHNDALQNVGGDGSAYVVRCNLSNEIMSGVGGPNSCVFSADFETPLGNGANSNWHLEVIDCLLNGTTASNPTISFYCGALTPNITYVATGNRFVRSSAPPVGRGTQNVTPTNQITWSNNVWDDDDSPIAL